MAPVGSGAPRSGISVDAGSRSELRGLVRRKVTEKWTQEPETGEWK